MQATALSAKQVKPNSSDAPGPGFAIPDLDNSFWRFSLAVYAAPGVADSCLRLQDAFGIDVNLLLFVAWIAADRHARMTVDELDKIEASAAVWHNSLVKPVRMARRELKASGGPVYAGIKAAELKLEQIEQALLHAQSFALDLAPRDTGDVIAIALAAYLKRHHAPENAADPLIAAARASA